MSDKYQGINSDKLKWQKHMLEANRIDIQVPKFGMCKVTREVILANIANGKHLDKIDYYFTPKSVKAAMKKGTTNTTTT